MSLTFEYLGQPLTQEKITPGNTVTSLTSGCYNYTEWNLIIDSGGTHELVAGDWIVGATGGGRAVIISVGSLDAGTSWAAGTADCTLRIASLHGTVFVDNEVLNHDVTGTATDCATADGVAHKLENEDYTFNGIMRGAQAKAALITVLDNIALIELAGNTPDQSAQMGIPYEPFERRILADINEIKNFKVVDYNRNAPTTIHVQYFF